MPIRTGTGESFRHVPDLLDKRLVFVTGKGGVGKTTVAAALAIVAARSGRRTLVCEVARQERIARSFGHEAVGPVETEIADNLSAISIDPQSALEEYLTDQLGSRRLAGLLFSNRIFDYFAAAAPGARELVTIGKAWEMAQPQRRREQDSPYDLVIVDAPASGHGIGMLAAPRTYRDAVRVGTIARQADTIDSFLTDTRRTGIIAVALPEEMPVNETADLERRLRDELELTVDRVVVNGVYPERFSADEAERIGACNGTHPVPAVRAALHAASWHHARVRTQRAQLRRLRRVIAAPATTLPYLFEEDAEHDVFQRLADDLGRRRL
jgi:anion-transporting  ArsA/GET3 family ATPase